MSNKMEDRMLAKAARSSVAKTPLDISELTISANNSCLELSGKVKRPKGHPGELNVRREYNNLLSQLRQVRGVKDVFGDRVSVFES